MIFMSVKTDHTVQSCTNKKVKKVKKRKFVFQTLYLHKAFLRLTEDTILLP